ncbi:MAG TPA: capsule assembly Wzi family protein [Terriglobales bacterium]|jgi:hypothetical protein
MPCCEINAAAQASSIPVPVTQQASSSTVGKENPSVEDKYQLQPGEDPENKLGIPFLKHLATDQEEFFTEPVRFRVKDLRWGAPLLAGTAALIASDSWLAKQVPDKPNQLKRSKDISNYGALSLVGVGGGAFLLGEVTHNDHLSEAGLLSGEAAINATAVSYLFKAVTQRPRPYQGNGNGTFFQGGGSFPSEHSAAAWAIASVWAHEYPGKLSQTLAYGLASAVTLTRVTSQQHFASDAAIGSLLGWYFGRSVYRAHHDPESGGAPWGSLLPENTGDKTRNPENMGSPYVPVDSWVYPLFDRMAALGYMHSGYEGMRPWTRMECARLVEEISEKLSDEGESNPEAQKLYDALAEEFSDETRRLDGAANVGATVDSVYTRSTVISGTPLRDGYHFGQTIINDYGRPYGEGFNNISGVTAHAVAGPFSVSIQGEYQHAPAVASDPLSVLQATAAQDGSLPLPNGQPEINRFRLLESSVGFTFKNVELSFGKQSLWLGPGDSGPFLFSDNAEPISMLRISQTSPVYVPALSRVLGPVKTEFFLGRLSGQQWVSADGTLFGPGVTDQPFIHGEKISFKPTKNFEFGMGFTALFGGPDLPVTWHNFFRTYTNFDVGPGSPSDPADRRSTFEFSYKVPRVRDYLSIYADSFVEDEFSPLGSTRPSMRMGVYAPKIPKIAKLELRLEGLYTDVPGQKTRGFIYWNGRYVSGYTNDGNLLASWIGRQGRGGQAWATYWLSSKSKIQFNYRHAEADRVFIGGGRLNDFGANATLNLRRGLNIAGLVQYEQWNFPVLAVGKQANITTSVQVTFSPHFQFVH